MFLGPTTSWSTVIIGIAMQEMSVISVDLTARSAFSRDAIVAHGDHCHCVQTNVGDHRCSVVRHANIWHCL
jgi:hypothetical protein